METELYDELGRKTAPAMLIPTVFGEPLLDAAHEIGRLQAELAEANKQVVDVGAEDGITFDGYQIRIHEHNLAGTIKARVRFDSHFLIKALIRELLSQSMEVDPDKPQERRSLDLTWVL